jgi:hypothetical protein
MKKLLLIALLFGGLSISTPGCIVRTHNNSRHGHVHRSRGHQPKRVRCARSQYWDGHQCRHKGRGHGARKHDRRY